MSTEQKKDTTYAISLLHLHSVFVVPFSSSLLVWWWWWLFYLRYGNGSHAVKALRTQPHPAQQQYIMSYVGIDSLLVLWWTNNAHAIRQEQMIRLLADESSLAPARSDECMMYVSCRIQLQFMLKQTFWEGIFYSEKFLLQRRRRIASPQTFGAVTRERTLTFQLWCSRICTSQVGKQEEEHHWWWWERMVRPTSSTNGWWVMSSPAFFFLNFCFCMQVMIRRRRGRRVVCNCCLFVIARCVNENTNMQWHVYFLFFFRVSPQVKSKFFVVIYSVE